MSVSLFATFPPLCLLACAAVRSVLRHATAFVVDKEKGYLLTAAHTFLKPENGKWVYRDHCTNRTCIVLVRPYSAQALEALAVQKKHRVFLVHCGVWLVSCLKDAECMIGLFISKEYCLTCHPLRGIPFAVLLWGDGEDRLEKCIPSRLGDVTFRYQ